MFFVYDSEEEQKRKMKKILNKKYIATPFVLLFFPFFKNFHTLTKEKLTNHCSQQTNQPNSSCIQFIPRLDHLKFKQLSR